MRKYTDPLSQRWSLLRFSFIWKSFSSLATNQLCSGSFRMMSVWKLPDLERLKVTRNAPQKSERIETGQSIFPFEFQQSRLLLFTYNQYSQRHVALSLYTIAFLQSKTLLFLNILGVDLLARSDVILFAARPTGAKPQGWWEGQALALQVVLRTPRSNRRQL